MFRIKKFFEEDNELQAALEASKQMAQNTNNFTEEEQLNIALAMSMDQPKKEKKKVAKIKKQVSNQSFWKFKFFLFTRTNKIRKVFCVY